MNTNTKRNSRKKSTNPLDSHIEQYVSELRASGRPLGAEAFSEAVRTFSQRFVEAMLQGEMDAHLTGCQPTETPPEEVDADELSLVPNKRNGFSHKTLKTEFGPLPLSVPRDRRNTFDPIIVPKHSRSFGKMDEQIIAMYARGMSTRDIQAFIDNLYGVDISPDYVSKVTDRVLEDVQEWQNRPLESVYPVAFFDAIRVKIRSGAAVKNMAVHLGIGVRTDGTREVLGMWIAENEGASFWATVFNGLKARGVEDILIAVTDGLKGMTEALETVYPQTLHQTCIVHLIRASTSFVSHKDRAAVCKELKPIYQAVDADAAERALERFGSTAMGKKYPAIIQIWERAWAQVIPFFQFPPEIRTLIYTTNAIEGLNRAIRKVIKTRTLFPNEDAAKKLIYLAIMNFTASWKRATPKWAAAMPQFALLFGERFTGAMEWRAIAGAKEDPPALRAGPSTLAPAIASGLAYCISNTKGSLVGLPLE